MRKVLYILGQLSDADVDWLAAAGRQLRIGKDATLIGQGSHPEAMYIVLEGAMSVVTANGTRIATVASGDILGEMSMLDSSPAVASVIADQDSAVLAVAKPELARKLGEDVAFAARFYRALAIFLADRLRGTIGKFGEAAGGAQGAGTGVEAGELDVEVLDKVHLAGARFERMLKKLAA